MIRRGFLTRRPGDLWNTRYAAVMLFEPIAPQFEKKAMAQVLAAVATRQNFSPTDPKAFQMFGRDEFRPVIDALTIGLQVLLAFVGTLTLGIGGVGVMNIMLVSVDERIREIGLRRALGARKRHIKLQFLAETLLIMILGGAIGVALSYVIAWAVGTMPMMGPAVRRRFRAGRYSPANFGDDGRALQCGAAGGGRDQRTGSRDARVQAGSGGSAAIRMKRSVDLI
jgi:ABC-type antimicrobial peptide transport system permease subunit